MKPYSSEDMRSYCDGLVDRNWDRVREEEARYRSKRLSSMTVAESYREFLELYELWAVEPPDELESLLRRESEERIEIACRRQAKFRALAAVEAER